MSVVIVLKWQTVRFVETNRTGNTVTEMPSTPDQKFWVQGYRFSEKDNTKFFLNILRGLLKMEAFKINFWKITGIALFLLR